MLVLLFLSLFSRAQSVECDLPCIERRFQDEYAASGSLYLPDLHTMYFGLPAQIKLERLLIHMGLEQGSEQNLTDVVTEMSSNRLQLRTLGFFEPKTEAQFLLNATRIRVEHIYTLEEQGYIGIAVGLMLIHRYNNTSQFPDLSVASAARIVAHDDQIAFPRVVDFIHHWKLSELGIVGVTRERIEGNSLLIRYAAQRIGFKHKVQFDSYTGFLWNQDTQLSTIRMVCKIDFPEKARVQLDGLNCNEFGHGIARKSCFSLMKLGTIKVNHDGIGAEKPWINLSLDTGYGNNDLAQLVDANVYGRTLFLGFSDIHLTNTMRLTDVSLVMVWAPATVHQIELGLLGEVKINILDYPTNLIAKVTVGMTGSCSLALYMTGIFRLMWIFPIWIGNINAVTHLAFGMIPVAGVFGVQINFGWSPDSREEDTRLKAMGLISFDSTNIQKNCMYAKVNPITIQSLVNMFVGHTKWKLPAFLATTGIHGIDERHGRTRRQRVWGERMFLRPRKFAENPQQFIITFSPLALQTEIIPELDSTAIIQPGLTVIGQVGILGVIAKAYIRLDHLHLGVEIDLTLDPVILGNGLVTLTAANVLKPHERVPDYMKNDGPSIYAGFQLIPSRGRKLPAPEFRLSGGLQVFGVRIALDVAVAQYGFHFKTELNIWDWFIAKCIIEVKSLEDGFKNGVRVYGELTIDSLSKLAHGFLKNVLKKMSEWKFWKKRIKDQEFQDHRRLGLESKFVKSLKKLKQKILHPITRAKLLSMKFDLSNAASKNAFPVMMEFEITLFGRHLITYKRQKQFIQFDNPLDSDAENKIAQETVDDLDQCLQDCEFDQDQCIRQIFVCGNVD